MMKLSSFDSMSITPTSKDEHNQGNHPIFIREFVAMFDEELNPVFEKKRRLSVNQVKELEKNFEVDNKLDPERKMKLAHEVGLHPRQVSVWFQNRRARWKTKQLERDYFILKSNYDSLKNAMEILHHENQAFLKEIEELKSTLNENGEQTKIQEMKEQVTEDKIKLDDSDSSGTMNNNNTAVSCFFPSHSCFQLADGEGEQEAERIYGYVERDFFGEEDSCSSFFSVDQAPTLQWYHSTDDWTLCGK